MKKISILVYLWFVCFSVLGGILKKAEKANPIEAEIKKEQLRLHSIRADKDGLALSTDKDNELRLTIPDFDSSVARMLDKAEEWSLNNPNVCENGKCIKPTVKLLVHIHGGLNSWDDTVKRMTLVNEIEADCVETDRYFPVFISWPSGYFGSYGEHLFRIRQGNRVKARYGLLLSPAVLVTDFAKGLVTVPSNWLRQGINIKDRLAYRDAIDDPESWLSRNYKMANLNIHRAQNGDLENYEVLVGEPHSGSTEVFKRYFWGLLTTPVKATVGTLAQGAMTPDAWQIMKRRARNFFYPPDLFEMKNNGNPGYKILETNTAAGRFFDLLIGRINEKTNFQYQITFVGHSMGTMILNHLFSTRRQDWINSKAIDKIIYMGAACSIAEAIQALNPLLGGFHAGDANAPKFYNLTLHPLAEMSEEMWPSSWPAGIVPAGSLLHLIDTHLETPNTPMDRTLGSQVNVMSTLEAFSEIKHFSHFKGFDFHTGSMPTRHGDFSNFPFWRKDFREGTAFKALSPNVQNQLK